MAKISKKQVISFPAIDAEGISQLLSDGMKDASELLRHEPITHVANVDIFSSQSCIVIEVELPGVRKDDIEVTLCKNTLSVKAVKFECFDEDKINYICMERSFGKIVRTVEMPFPVDSMRIKAQYKNGILTISIPRVQDKRSAVKKINIEEGPE
ncbi:MAG: Hsp20/alpha crystallin family protein [Deltaproteobacteria bacterium]